MFVEKEFAFEASHVLPRHAGKCSRLHGHSWRVRVGVFGHKEPDTQFVLDFGVLGEITKPVVDFLDHRHLNYVMAYPSSENVCLLFASVLSPILDTGHPIGIHRLQVAVSETAKTWATWDSAAAIGQLEVGPQAEGYGLPVNLALLRPNPAAGVIPCPLSFVVSAKLTEALRAEATVLGEPKVNLAPSIILGHSLISGEELLALWQEYAGILEAAKKRAYTVRNRRRVVWQETGQGGSIVQG